MESRTPVLGDDDLILAARLLAVTDVALAHLDLDDLLHALLGRLQALLSGDVLAILMCDPATDTLLLRAELGLAGTELARPTPAGHGFTGRIVAERQALAVSEIAPGDDDRLPLPLQGQGVCSVLGVPLVVEGAVTGVLFMGSRYVRDFPPDEAHLLQLAADRAALAIENARVHAETKAALATREAFLSIASHELRTPLTTLKGFLQLAQRRLDQRNPERAAQFLTWADQQVDRLDELIGLLLHAAGLPSDRSEVNGQFIDLVPLVQAVVEHEQAAYPAHPVAFSAPSRPAWLLGNASELEQVLAGLLSNARKYSPIGTPIAVRVGAEDGWLSIIVEDHGIGIPADEQGAIFERFHRARNVDPGVSGLGLGLYVAKEIVTSHGGTLTVDSRPGQGSTFTVRLPRRFPASMRGLG